jgi:prepilin-type N-terminal cleavage/methylation domain-containing protein
LKQGLTLLELVIVLFILAALTGVAVRSLGPVADQARYERSQQLMIEIEQAYQLRSIEAGGPVYYSGFIADMGRLPISRPGDDPSTQASELWELGNLPTFAIHDDFYDPDTQNGQAIPVAAGWKGPYLLLPPGSTGLRDGFGNPLVPRNSGNLRAVVDDPIEGFVSPGSNGEMNSTDVNYERDLNLPGGLWNSARYEGTVPFRVIDTAGLDPVLMPGETLRVRLYGPTNGVPGRIDEQNLASGVFSGSVSGTCGPRVLKAFVTTGSAPNESVVRESIAYQIMISPGMNSTRQLVIP